MQSTLKGRLAKGVLRKLDLQAAAHSTTQEVSCIHSEFLTHILPIQERTQGISCSANKQPGIDFDSLRSQY